MGKGKKKRAEADLSPGQEPTFVEPAVRTKIKRGSSNEPT